MGYQQALATGELGLTQGTTDIYQQLGQDIYSYQQDWEKDQRSTLNVLLGMDIWGDNGGGGVPYDPNPYDPGASGPPGWPSVGAYDSWVAAGSDPSNAVNYGWQSQYEGDVPSGYK
jgi:hypothetical protein